MGCCFAAELTKAIRNTMTTSQQLSPEFLKKKQALMQ
jgi:hypothetical protein